MKWNPLVSFLMPTFGRCAQQPHVLDEAVYWFIKQDYEPKELVILNDAPAQALCCTVPGVRVFNRDERFPTLGAKMNELVRLAGGEVCLVYEDDDISLPWRARQAVDALADGYDYWTPQLRWYEERGKRPVADAKGCAHHCAAYRRDVFLNAYQHVTKGHDIRAHDWAVRNLRCNKQVLTDPSQISYFYRWGVSQYHLSGFHDMDLAYAKAHPGPGGVYFTEPVMGEDYLRLHEDLCCSVSLT